MAAAEAKDEPFGISADVVTSCALPGGGGDLINQKLCQLF
jgi:hypothetical protein